MTENRVRDWGGQRKRRSHERAERLIEAIVRRCDDGFVKTAIGFDRVVVTGGRLPHEAVSLANSGKLSCVRSPRCEGGRRGREPTRPLAVSILMASRTAVRLIFSSDERTPSFGRPSIALKRPETIWCPRRFTSSTVIFPEPKAPNALSAVGMSLLAYGLIPQSSSFLQVHLGGVLSQLQTLLD